MLPPRRGWLKDVWLAEELGLKYHPHRSEYKLTFTSIKQPWLKIAAKRYLLYRSGTKALKTVIQNLGAINKFSIFLSEQHSLTGFANINRYVIIDYLSWLNANKLHPITKCHYLGTLKDFFEIGCRENWFDVPRDLIRKDDYPTNYPRYVNKLPRYIPDEIIQQLNQHLDKLPEPVMRMVLVIQECGLRISELCQLSLDCLKRDTKGDYFIQFMRWKMNKETTLPISKELAIVIQEQQTYINENLDENYKYLFCGRKGGFHGGKFFPKPEVMKEEAFSYYLNNLAEKFDICDSLGNRWRFQTHQFRHTVGTRMINLSVPVHIIQRYLGHDSPEMTMRYTYIHDETLKNAVIEFHSKIINISGQVVELENPELDNDLDLQWMKKNILAQSLPNGFCARPILKGSCPHANACLTCGDFRTTKEFLAVHKEELEHTKNVIEKAKANGWQRQVEMNEQVKNNLENVIKALGNDDL